MNIGLGIGIPFTRSSLWTSIFTPTALFMDGSTEGVWYDPSDLTTLYQDAAGTTPVTAVEQPVGLMLDKSKRLVLGPELVTNGDFSNGTTGWTLGAGWAVSGGAATFTTPGFSSPITQNILTANKHYRLTFTLSGPSINVRPYLGSYTFSQFYTSAGTYTVNFQAGPDAAFGFQGAAGATFSVDNVSVRELPGNHAFQTTSTKRPVLSARVNLLTKTEDFADSYWTKNASISVTNGVRYSTVSVPNTLGSGVNIVYKQSVSTLPRLYYSLKVRGPVGLSLMLSDDYGNATVAFTGDWQTISFTSSDGGGGFHQFYIRTASANQTYTFDISEASLVPADQSSLPYQRVNTATDYDTQGFPTYLKFDSIDDALQTNSIDFTATDKMQVFAGVRKLSDGDNSCIFELSANYSANAGSFVTLLGKGTLGTAPAYTFGSRGSGSAIFTDTAQNYPAPLTNVLTVISNISGDQAILRVNGAQAAISTTDQGTGNYGNYPLYIGARAGTSLFFNGNLYQLIIAGGSVINIAEEEDLDLVLNETGDSITAETTVPIGTSTIEACERFVNRKTLAY